MKKSEYIRQVNEWRALEGKPPLSPEKANKIWLLKKETERKLKNKKRGRERVR